LGGGVLLPLNEMRRPWLLWWLVFCPILILHYKEPFSIPNGPQRLFYHRCLSLRSWLHFYFLTFTKTLSFRWPNGLKAIKLDKKQTENRKICGSFWQKHQIFTKLMSTVTTYICFSTVYGRMLLSACLLNNFDDNTHTHARHVYASHSHSHIFILFVVLPKQTLFLSLSLI
jgi:hypothetical protein